MANWLDHIANVTAQGCCCKSCGAPKAPELSGARLTAKQMDQIAREYALSTFGRLRVIADDGHPYRGDRAA